MLGLEKRKRAAGPGHFLLEIAESRLIHSGPAKIHRPLKGKEVQFAEPIQRVSKRLRVLIDPLSMRSHLVVQELNRAGKNFGITGHCLFYGPMPMMELMGLMELMELTNGHA